jgi:hypothetical protein
MLSLIAFQYTLYNILQSLYAEYGVIFFNLYSIAVRTKTHNCQGFSSTGGRVPVSGTGSVRTWGHATLWGCVTGNYSERFHLSPCKGSAEKVPT